MILEEIMTNLFEETNKAITDNATETAFDTRLYIWPKAEVLHGAEPELLENIMENFLNNPEQHMHVLVGDPGAGKTTFAKKWLGKYLFKPELTQHCKFNPEKETRHYLPIFITLTELLPHGKEKESNFYFQNILKTYFEEIGFDKMAINTLKNSVHLLIFLDGYDEISYKGNLFRDNNWHKWPHCKFVITTRPEKFGNNLTEYELQYALTCTFSTTGTSENDPQLVITNIKDFDENNIKEFIRQWVDFEIDKKNAWKFDQYWEAINSIPDLGDLAVNPFILRLILFALPGLQEKFANEKEEIRVQQTRLSVYREFVNLWFQRQVGFIGHDKNILISLKQLDPELYNTLNEAAPKGLAELILNYLHRYTRKLAYHALLDSEGDELKSELSNKITLNPVLLYDIHHEDPIIQSLSSDQKNTLLIILRKGCLLRCDKNYFRFFHKSIIEYFTQEHIQKSVVGLSDIILQHQSHLVDAKSNERLINFSLNKHSVIDKENLRKFLVEKTQEDKFFEKNLIEIVLLSKEYSDISIAAANAITILNQANYPIHTLDLRGIRIPGADLSRTTLHLTDFSNADLSQVNFNNTYLNNANFTGANLKNCNLGHANQINFDERITACLFTQDGRWLIAGDNVGNIYRISTMSWIVEEIKSQVPLLGFKVNNYVTCLATKYDKNPILASGSKSGDIYLWKLPPLNQTVKIKSPYANHSVKAIALHPTQELLTSLYKDESLTFMNRCHILLWNTDTCEIFKKFEYRYDIEAFSTFSFHPTQKSLLAIDRDDKAIYFWDTKTDKTFNYINTVNNTKDSFPITFHSTLPLIAYGTKIGTIWIDSINSGEILKKLIGHTKKITNLIFHPKEWILASSSEDKTIRLWDVKTGNELGKFQSHHTSPPLFAFHPIHPLLIFSGNFNASLEIHFWNTHSDGRFKTNIPNDNIRLLAFQHEQNLLAYTDKDKTIHLFNYDINLILKEFKNVYSSPKKIIFHPSQPILASIYEDNTLLLWNIETGELLKNFKFNKARYYLTCTFHPRLPFLALTYPSKIMLLNTNTGEIKKIDVDFIYCHEAIFHPIRPIMAVRPTMTLYDQESKSIHLWNIETSKLSKIKVHTKTIYRALEFSILQQNLLAVISKDKTIRLWNIETNKEIKKLVGHTSIVISLTFHSNQSLLASYSVDESIRLWNIGEGSCTQVILINNFTNEKYYFEYDASLLFTQNNNLEILYRKRRKWSWGRNDRIFQVLLFTENSESNKYQLTNIKYKDYLYFSATGLNLTNTTGLSESQYKFLTNQGAIGTPQHFAITTTDLLDIEEEKIKLFELNKLLTSLEITVNDALQETNSLFPGDQKLKIGFNYWQVSIFRIINTKKENKSTKSNPQEKSSIRFESCSDTIRHAYCLFEGRDAMGRHVWIRIDFVNDTRNKGYGRVKNITHTAFSNDPQSAKNAFMKLFEDSNSGTPTEIDYYVAGRIDKNQMITLIKNMMNDQQRQYGPEEKRIRYKSFGGDESSTQNSHNCLTWLRAHFLNYPNLIIPRALLDPIIVNPAQILNSQGFFSNNVHPMNLSDWQNNNAESLDTPRHKH